MKTETDFITPEEMIELTGYQSQSKQCKVLERAGIFFIKRPDGHPKTTWAHFNHPMEKRLQIAAPEEPDFGAM